MENQARFRRIIRTIAFLYIGYIVLGALLLLPVVSNNTYSVRLGADEYSRFTINWFSCFNEIFFLTLLTCLFVAIVQQSSTQRFWKASSALAFVSIGLSLTCSIIRIMNFVFATHYTHAYWIVLRALPFFVNIATLLLIIAVILLIIKMPHHTLGFFGGLSFIVSQFICLLFFIFQFILWTFLFRISLLDSALYNTLFTIVIPSVSIFLFLIVNISFLLFLFGLSGLPLSASRNLTGQGVGDADNVETQISTDHNQVN